MAPHLTLVCSFCDTLRCVHTQVRVHDGKADAISALLDGAKALVQRARDSAGAETCKGPMLTVDQANAQVLYETVALWELHVEVLMGLVVVSPDGTVKATHEGRLSHKDGTVAFGRHLDAKWDGVVKSLKPRFQSVAMARHWYAEPVHCWHYGIVFVCLFVCLYFYYYNKDSLDTVWVAVLCCLH
jgi:hypothetical protein